MLLNLTRRPLSKQGEAENTLIRDFLTLQDYSKEEIWNLLETARRFKGRSARSREAKKLEGKFVVLLFQKSSTRTRVSFEVAVTQLGGHSLYFGWRESQLGRAETIADTARVLEQYVDGIVARVYNQTDLEELAKNASIPVINALSDLYHPCQILADLYTIWEKRDSIEGLKVAYVGDGNNVCNSLLIGCSKMGINISVASPPIYEPFTKAVELARKNSQTTSSKVEIFRDPAKAAENADVIYTDTFVSMGDEAKREERLRVFLPEYQVTNDLFKHAAKDALFMHCLPAHRNEEVTGDVIDGPRSIVWEEAENRLHTAKAILANVIE